MSNEKLQDIPAAFPALTFVSGLLAAGIACGPLPSAAGFASIAILLAVLQIRSARIPVCLLSCAAGLYVGGIDAIRKAGDEAFIRAHEARFVVVKAPLNRGWGRREDGQWIMRTASFEVTEDQKISRRFRSPLTIYMASSPQSIGSEHSLLAEGLLKSSAHGSFILIVKSPLLLGYAGQVPAWNPALWNRTAAAGLDAYARAHPGRARSVALAEALALGRSERLTADLRESYRRGGIYHLLVFSGMQIAIAAAFLSLILRGFGAPRAADLMLLLLSLTAPPFAGHEASVSRASWMLGLYAASRLMQRPTPAANLLFVSAMIRLTLVPTELSNAGFLLTYAATGGLVLFGPALAALFARRKFLLALAAGLGAEIATTGLVLFFFHQYVIGSSLVTIALSPLVTAMLALSASAALAVVFCPAATGLCLEALSRLDGLIAMATDLIANRLGLFGFAPRPHLFVLLAAWIASLLLFAISRSRQTRIAAVLLLLVPVADSLVLARTRAHIRGPQLEMLDVGQGDSMLLRTSTGSMLVDGGGKAGDDDFGRRVLLPMLAERAVRSIDVIALSHPDGDHCGGLPGVVAAIPVHEIWISRRHLDSLCGQRLLDLASNRHILVLLMPATPEMRRIGLRIEPLVPRLTFKHSPVNNSSVVYRITAAGTRVLLTGDIEKDAETLLADEERETISADILKVAHHGSRTSSSEGFIDAVRPRIALISCGFRNPFGHPGAVTLSRLRQHHAVTYRTDRNGAILLRLGEWPTPVETESQRIP